MPSHRYVYADIEGMGCSLGPSEEFPHFVSGTWQEMHGEYVRDLRDRIIGLQEELSEAERLTEDAFRSRWFGTDPPLAACERQGRIRLTEVPKVPIHRARVGLPGTVTAHRASAGSPAAGGVTPDQAASPTGELPVFRECPRFVGPRRNPERTLP